MIARFHYDEATLNRLLHDQLHDDEHEVSEHVETCEVCQEHIDTLSRNGLSWDDVGELLRSQEIATNRATESLSEISCDRQLETYTSLLQPTEHPGSLGRFARYEILEFLGRGGMGLVMRGYDTSLDRHCAVKVLAPELATSAAARKRFSREAKSAAAVVHRHVVPIQTVDEFNGLPYLVMPVVEGKSLEARVCDSGPLQPIEAIRIAAQIADGLAAAHAQGLVHRDIKPANVLLENGIERVQITDFGLARAIDDASMTRSGVITGTPQYMSPEQAHGDAIDHRSDLFSMGSVMYFMLAGRSPFRAETTMGVLNRIGNDEPRSLQTIAPDIPIWLNGIVLKLLSKSPSDRFESADQVAELLENCLAHVQQPAANPLPAAAAKLIQLSDACDINSTESLPGSRFPRIPKPITAAAFAFSLMLAGIMVVLELSKGTLTIRSEVDDVTIRIKQGDHVVKELSVSKEEKSTRIAAGAYVVEVDGDITDLSVVGGVVSLQRGETRIVTIVKSDTPKTAEAKQPGIPLVEKMERISILGPTTSQGQAKALEPPSIEEIMWAWENAHKENRSIPFLTEKQRKNVRVIKEKIADYVDPPRIYPHLGAAQLHHAHYKCTIRFDEKTTAGYPTPHTLLDKKVFDVVYIDHTHFHLLSGPDPEKDEDLYGDTTPTVPVESNELTKRTATPYESDNAGDSKTVQVVFYGPDELAVQAMREQASGTMLQSATQGYGYEDQGPCPSRFDFTTSSNHFRRLRLTGIPGHHEVAIHPILMLPPVNQATQTWLAHNAIPIRFTSDDFEHVLKGDRVSKIIYLPRPQFQNQSLAGFETLVSTRLDPGVNPILEARRRGHVVAVLHIEDYDKRKTATYDGMPLEEAVRNLNLQLSRRPHLPEQPPLTVEEVVAWARWNLSLLKGKKYKHYRDPYLKIVNEGVMPDEGSFSGDVVKYTEDKLTVYTFQIGMNYMVPLFSIDGDIQHYVRRRYTKSEVVNEERTLFTNGIPLSLSIDEFNQVCQQEDPEQPPLTEEEVIAALRNTLFEKWIDRPKNMPKEAIAIVHAIISDRELPASAEFVLNTDFKSDGASFKIWRPSIRITIGDSAEPTTIPLRTHFISSTE